jgi:ribosomal protein S18 acetylase RimI-like enzyme
VIVTRTYLELLAPTQLRRAAFPDDAAVFIRLVSCPTDHYRWLYRTVGHLWRWTDRSNWSDDQIRTHLDSPAVALWELRVADEIAGYAELQRHQDDTVEIAYFGLMPGFFARRLGASMLTAAATEAWRMGASRVWLHTCTLDSARALPNYLARGFTPFRQEQYEAPDASAPPPIMGEAP